MDIPLHPLVVHFPIALLLVGIVLMILSYWKKQMFANAAIVVLSIGWVGAVVSYLSGDDAEEYARDRWGSGLHNIIEKHESMALITVLLFAALIAVYVLWKYRPSKWWIPLIVVLSIAGSITLTLTGHYGGQIVYQTDQVKQVEHGVHEIDEHGED